MDVKNKNDLGAGRSQIAEDYRPLTDALQPRYRRLSDIPEIALLSRREQRLAWRYGRRQVGWPNDLILYGAEFVIVMMAKAANDTLLSYLSRHGVNLSAFQSRLLHAIMAFYPSYWFYLMWFNRTAHRVRPYLAQYLESLQDLSHTCFSDSLNLLQPQELERWRRALVQVGSRLTWDESTVSPEDAAHGAEVYTALCTHIRGDEGRPVIQALLDSMQTGQDYGAYQPAIEALKQFPSQLLAEQLVEALPILIDRAPDRASEVIGCFLLTDSDAPAFAQAFNHHLKHAPHQDQQAITDWRRSAELTATTLWQQGGMGHGQESTGR